MKAQLPVELLVAATAPHTTARHAIVTTEQALCKGSILHLISEYAAVHTGRLDASRAVSDSV
jgi:hypothetical protein